jgi:hypothetical protein
MRVNPEFDSRVGHALSDLVESGRHFLAVLASTLIDISWPVAAIDLQVIALEPSNKIHKLHVILNSSGPLSRINEIHSHSAAIRDGFEL